MQFSILNYSFGLAAVATEDTGVFWLDLDTEAPRLFDRFFNLYPQYVNTTFTPIDPVVQDKVQVALDTGVVDPNLVLYASGTLFQKAIWRLLQEHTAPGKNVSYKFIAEKLGQPKAVRAVANAIGANRIAILIPCHRIIRSDGTSGGYRWGEVLKQKLLERESKY